MSDYQIGGSHYIRCAVQPWEIIERNELGFFDGNVIKYMLRYKMKGGVEDLLKAQHYLSKLINIEERKINVQNRRSEGVDSEVFEHLVQELRSRENCPTPPYEEANGWLAPESTRSSGLAK